MISIDDYNNHYCGENFVNVLHGYNNIYGIDIVYLNNINFPCALHVKEKGINKTNVFVLNIMKPEYLISTEEVQMREESKIELMDILNSNWDTLLEKINEGCKSECGYKKYYKKCNIFCNRKIPLTPPDYNLLDQIKE